MPKHKEKAPKVIYDNTLKLAIVHTCLRIARCSRSYCCATFFLELHTLSILILIIVNPLISKTIPSAVAFPLNRRSRHTSFYALFSACSFTF